jgi:hypothetical protein
VLASAGGSAYGAAMFHRLLRLAACCVALGCGRETASPPAPRSVPERIEWPAVAAASGYAVRAWCGDRLVFEEETQQASLLLDTATRRACAQFDTLELHIRARGAAGDPIVMRLWP